MRKFILFFLIPIFGFAQIQMDENEAAKFLSAGVWNISYNISPDGERIEEENPEKIKAAWVKFNTDGSYEMPNEMTGKTIGSWTFDAKTAALHFKEGRIQYRAIVEELSDINLLLNYIDNGGFKIGLIHYVYTPVKKSAEDIQNILTSGRWNVVSQRFDDIFDKTPAEDLNDTWLEFHSDYTYSRSEVFEDETKITEGSWFLDDKNRVNLDADEMSIYSVSGDNTSLILTSITDGIKIIECRKAK